MHIKLVGRSQGELAFYLAFVTTNIFNRLYYFFVYLFFTYGWIAWGNTYTTTLEPVVVFQKKGRTNNNIF